MGRAKYWSEYKSSIFINVHFHFILACRLGLFLLFLSNRFVHYSIPIERDTPPSLQCTCSRSSQLINLTKKVLKESHTTSTEQRSMFPQIDPQTLSNSTHNTFIQECNMICLLTINLYFTLIKHQYNSSPILLSEFSLFIWLSIYR